MVATHKLVKKFQDFQKRLDWINIKLSQIRETGKTKNLLSVHYELYHIEDFKDSTLYKAQDGPSDLKITLSQMFKPLEEISLTFSDTLWSIAQDCFSYLGNNQLSTILHILKIVECEEKADLKAIEAEEARKNRIKLGGFDSDSKKWKMAEGSQRTLKYYKAQLFENLKIAISERIKELLEGIQEDDIFGTLDALQEVPEDLKLIQQQLIHCFPPEYEAFKFFLFEYQKTAYFLVDKLAMKKLDNLEGGQIIHTLRFLQEYQSLMKSRVGVSEEILDPKFFDGNPSVLVEAYLDVVRNKLNEWINNMTNIEVNAFLERSNAPKTDSEGRYNMSISIIAFQIYDQQIDISSESDSARLVVEVVKECTKASIAYQQRFLSIIESENQKYQSNPDDMSPGYMEYLISLANDQLKSVDMGDDLTEKISELLTEAYIEKASGFISEQTSGFLKVAGLAIESIVKLIFKDIKTTFEKLFTSRWYEEHDDIIPAIVSTFQDYFQDGKAHLHPFLYQNLIKSAMEMLVIGLLKLLNARGVKFRASTSHALFDRDYDILFSFFKEIIQDNAMVIKHFDPYRKILNIIKTPHKMLFLELFPIFKKFNDLPIKYVQDILSRRDDLDRAAKSEIGEFIAEKFNREEIQIEEDQSNNHEHVSNIFSKMLIDTNFNMDSALFSKLPFGNKAS